MGHKVHPNGFRLGVYRNWEAKWFAPDKEYKPLLLEDVRLRRMLMIRLKNAGLARIETERSSSALTITLHTAKPGIVIGKGGTSVDQLRDELEKITGKRVRVTIQEIKKPELAAQLVAENVAAQLEKRIAFRRAIKQSLMKTMRAGAQGVKIRVKGRLGGSEMARVEWNREGRVPLHTLKADIDFGQTEAKTTFGRIGVSAWVYTGNFPTEAAVKPPTAAEEPVESGVPVGLAIGEAPSPLAELVQVAVPVPSAPAAPAVAPAAPAPVTADAAAAAKPKRAPRATKPATEATTADAGEKAAPKRTARARATTTDKAEPAKAPRARATKKKE
ncbi:MAG TPA: 30S ribosomal protein S3 [Candidatus Dormibacteraeota bacterium]|jgi:small subunit ribosomal protein S3|nr:30S ribosomal protein S3 [Candidatus Dormibacteraeota bacterium]